MNDVAKCRRWSGCQRPSIVDSHPRAGCSCTGCYLKNNFRIWDWNGYMDRRCVLADALADGLFRSQFRRCFPFNIRSPLMQLNLSDENTDRLSTL